MKFRCPKMRRKKHLLVLLVQTVLFFHTGKLILITDFISDESFCSLIIKTQLNLKIILVHCGNYYPCSWNPCEPHGQCISMYPSPNMKAYTLPVPSQLKTGEAGTTSSNKNDIFFITPSYSRWTDASKFCIDNDASLLEISPDNNNNLR